MIIFNPLGTHVSEDGQLKVRVDVYPVEGMKTWDTHHIYYPIEPIPPYPGEIDKNGEPVDMADYDSWWQGLPREWKTNPILSAFIEIDEDTTKEQLEAHLADIFDANNTATLDDIISKPNSLHLVSPFMRDKTTISKKKVLDGELAKSSANEKFSGISSGVETGGEVLPVEPESIDVGPGAVDLGGTGDTSNNTVVDLTNPANADGTIDTYEFWFLTSGALSVKAAIMYGSGTSYTCRDWESVGAVPSGSKQTYTGLSISVQTGDFAGVWLPTGHGIEYSASGGSGLYRKDGDQTEAGTQTYIFVGSAYRSALYGTGVESGGEVEILIKKRLTLLGVG